MYTFSLRSSAVEPGIANLFLANVNKSDVRIDKVISVHTISNVTNRSMFLDVIGIGGQWNPSAARFVVKHVTFIESLKGSIIAICFYLQASSNCF
jgi:hypothetical protein